MKKKFKSRILLIPLLIFFFTWGVLTSHYKIFPYTIIKFIKDNTYDKIVGNEKFYPGVTRKSSRNFSKFYEKYPNYLKNKPFLTRYNKNTNIWLDKLYYNHKNDDKLNNFYLIKIKRHQTKKIKIFLPTETEIYRMLCSINDNNQYQDWEIVNFEVAMIGKSCVHTKVVKKKFKKGFLKLDSGGPVSSDPIFILNKFPETELRIY